MLVVEDDSALRELYRSALRTAGFAVVAVDDGLSALRQVESATPTAVILDLNLPRISGRDVKDELQSHDDTHDIPIIVISGADTTDLDPADLACILRKPVNVEDLVDTVRRCVSRWAGEKMSKRSTFPLPAGRPKFIAP